MNPKKQVLVAIDELPEDVWNGFLEQMNIVFVRDGQTARQQLAEHQFDVVFLDLFLFGVDSLQLLRQMQDTRVVLTSEAPNFQFAREGILHGAADYLIRPLDRRELEQVFTRIAALEQSQPQLEQEQQQWMDWLRTDTFPKALYDGLRRIGSASTNDIQAAADCRRAFTAWIKQVFFLYPWLRLYLAEEECISAQEIRSGDTNVVQQICLDSGRRLNALLMDIYPKTEDKKMYAVCEDMLTHVDQPFRQKELAQRFFISAPTLSKRFAEILHIPYQQYHQTIKMMRAAFLLRNTDQKLYEICEALGFRDVNYFSRLFRQRYGMTVSEYRREPQWDFQI